MIGWQRVYMNKQNWLALTLIGCFVVVAIIAPLLAPPADPDNPGLFKVVGTSFKPNEPPHPPDSDSLFGTTTGQRDVFYTLVWGTRSALRFGLTVTLLTSVVGVLVGAISGYLGGIVNDLTLRVTDAFLAFPPIAAVWLFRRVMFPIAFDDPFVVSEPTFWQTFFGALHLDPTMLALILFSWMPYTRIINTLVSQVKQSDFVMAARAMGAGNGRILFRHILPNTIAPAIVLATRDIGGVVILESAFTFVGLGGGSGAWGVLLVVGRDYIIGQSGNPLVYWWVFVPVSLVLILFGIGWNLLGDGINLMLNPKAAQGNL